LKALEDEHPEIRSRALGVLAAMGVERKVLVARMVKMMNDENQPVQVRWVIAATHLPQLGTDAESALPDVMRLAKTSNSKLSTDPRFSLGLLGADYELRAAAYLALGKIGKDHSEVIPVLLEGLHDVNSTARGNAAWGIGTIRQAPELCVSALLQ